MGKETDQKTRASLQTCFSFSPMVFYYLFMYVCIYFNLIFLLTWFVSYFNQLAFNIPFFFFYLCRRSLLFSNPRMKSPMGTLILSGPSGCRSSAVPAALAVIALSSTRAIFQRLGPAWWTKNWNSTLYPVQRSVTCLQRALLP